MRIAFFSPPLGSHVAVYGALAAALAQRGHECFLVAHPGAAALISTPALELAPLDASGLGWSPATILAHARHPGLPLGVLRVVKDMAAQTGTLCRQAPAMLRRLGIDGIVSDQMESAGALVAEHLGLPFATVAAALPINREPLVPLPVLPWPWQDTPEAAKRNRVGERVADVLTAPLDRLIAREAARLGLPSRRSQVDCLSPLADLAQVVEGFDFPRRALPTHFHHVGPIRGTGGSGAPMPPAGRDRPFVFCSFGTLQGHRLALFRRVARAARALDVRLLVAHCGGLTPEQAATVEAEWVVDRVDQAEAVRRADVVVTHCGLNTVLDALEAGTPMLCLPLAFDQPGVAARVERLGAGLVLSRWAGARAIAAALGRLLHEESFRSAARSLQPEFTVAGGAAAAAAIVEEAIRTRRPVLREPREAAA